MEFQSTASCRGHRLPVQAAQQKKKCHTDTESLIHWRVEIGEARSGRSPEERRRHVYYPGLTSHPEHHIAKKQMNGFGGVVSFEVDRDL
ncbi:cystathionine gamma-synthase 1, chloroplastic-like [Olea europaea subsp. europaea]|uniref:Cystathionine gamma-synthase 1, chloroplastic-like n=1 Tax=Olea europaea subsp. europaea TaxID=158383 RepID=A0A8S0RRT8_OLEEU|nr:cystathionine gamma-synthase 1, chloroplastic-like [Olea europaea subsp. europaea]